MSKFEKIEQYVANIRQPNKVNFACRYVHSIINNRPEPRPAAFNLRESSVTEIYLQISKILRA